jgi:hypothetical protein
MVAESRLAGTGRCRDDQNDSFTFHDVRLANLISTQGSKNNGKRKPLLPLVIIQHTMFWLFHIIELTFLNRPDKDQPAAGSEAERKDYQQYDAFIHDA